MSFAGNFAMAIKVLLQGRSCGLGAREAGQHHKSRHAESFPGTSLQNYPNADAILKLVRCMVGHGIKERQISILTYYRGQIKTITIRAGPDDPLADNVATVDSY